MKLRFLYTICLINLLWIASWATTLPQTLSQGSQPQVSMDGKGILRIVFGRNDSIFCAVSKNQGNSFSAPNFVGHVTGMHLGMSRGPQLAASLHTAVITAMDKLGDIHFFQLDAAKGAWIKKGFVNDKRSSAPEGLMGLAADAQDNFYAVWLDTRQEKKNNIYFSMLSGKTGKWSSNLLAYRSPDSHVCECCKPNIAVKNGTVVIMFRNWLEGSRDLYTIRSVNNGLSFSTAQKLGAGTWKLNGCPMDGGALSFDKNSKVQTTWQRKGVVYTCSPGENEIKLAAGRGSNMSMNEKGQWVVSFQEGENTKLLDRTTGKQLMTVKGNYMKPLLLPGGKLFCAWERDKTIMFSSL
jgi:hypothetical protein